MITQTSKWTSFCTGSACTTIKLITTKKIRRKIYTECKQLMVKAHGNIYSYKLIPISTSCYIKIFLTCLNWNIRNTKHARWEAEWQYKSFKTKFLIWKTVLCMHFLINWFKYNQNYLILIQIKDIFVFFTSIVCNYYCSIILLIQLLTQLSLTYHIKYPSFYKWGFIYLLYFYN